jgi:hypothetical protein
MRLKCYKYWTILALRLVSDVSLFALSRRSAQIAANLPELEARQGIVPSGVCEKDSEHIRSY